jgi:squalene-hopene/tetraprenyl-beta-curcumene cyclase
MSALSTEPNVQSLDRIRAAVQAAQRALGSLQKKDGHWCAELEGDSILQSEYLLMKWILRQEREPLVDGRPGTTLRKIVEQLRSQQRPDGGWGQFPGSGIDISGTVKGYFCLKLAGDSPDAPHMRRAREVILRMGGAERCNSFTNFYLACLGQISWNAVPSIPPEMVWMPKWFYFHLNKMSAWSRTMLLPLAIVTVLRPTRQLDAQQGIDELFVSQQARHRLKMRADVPAFWRAFFGSVDWIMKRVHDVFGTRWRRRAIEQAFNWSATRMGQEMPAPTSGLGAIFPPMVYIQVVMQALARF